MKKIVLFSLICFSLIFLAVGVSQAADLVPCGKPGPAGQPGTARCELTDLFRLIENIYNYILTIGTFFAGLMVVLGGVMILISAGDPGLAGTGRRILWGAIIGMLLIWTAWLIIHTLLWILGVSPDFIQ